MHLRHLLIPPRKSPGYLCDGFTSPRPHPTRFGRELAPIVETPSAQGDRVPEDRAQGRAPERGAPSAPPGRDLSVRGAGLPWEGHPGHAAEAIPPSTLHSGAHSLPASELRLMAVQGPSRVMGAPSIYTLINADKEGCVRESGRTQHGQSVSLKPLPTRSGDVCITFGMGVFF